jgi:hypothetical protein
MDRTNSEAPLEQLPTSLRKLLTFERFHLHKPELIFRKAGELAFDSRYLPHNCGAVQLPCYWIERRHLHAFGSWQPAVDELDLSSGNGPHDSLLFPIHPAAAAHYAGFLEKVRARDAARDGLRVWAVPTSSTRTFLAWPDGAPERALFVKTTLDSKVVGDRRLYRWKVARSVGLSQLVHDSLAALPADLSYFPESFGLVPRQLADSGVIFRSIPRELKDDGLLVAPLFSLMGGGAAALFPSMVEQGRVQPLEFLEEVMCDRFARLWLQMTLQFGLILESHGQDLLMTLSHDLTPLNRFYYRDFEGLQVDWELRHALGLRSPEPMPNAQAWYETYATWGHRYGALVSHKLRISLIQYLRLVLRELGLMLREWHRTGLMPRLQMTEDDLTAIFSRRMMVALREQFGVCVGAQYNIEHSLNRFILLLIKLRRELLYTRAVGQPVGNVSSRSERGVHPRLAASGS